MNNKKLLFLVIGFIALIGISYFAYFYLNSKYQDNSVQNESSINSNYKKEIDFTVSDQNQKGVALSDYLGKPVIVNFWASWCPPCKAEMPEFNKLASKYSSNQLVILMVNMTDGQRETVSTAGKYISDNKYNLNVLFDSDGEAAAKYNVTSIPRTLFINQDGYIISDYSGQITSDELDKNTNKLLGK